MRGISVVLSTLLATATLTGAASGAPDERPAMAKPMPTLRVTTEVAGLTQPWDVQQLPGGELLVSERDTRQLTVWDGDRLVNVLFPRNEVLAHGETGLMGLAVDPDFADSRRIYTCYGHRTKMGREVRVVAWQLNQTPWEAIQPDVLVKRMPASDDGRHGGCRLLIARNGALLIGTGDAAASRNPQRLKSLGGKVLRIDRHTGKPWPTNPWAKAKNRNKRKVFTYGHRNVQGLAQRKDGSLWSVEHGSFRDDEVNRLRKGGNYGWDPGPGYDESVPMTDHSLPGKQRNAKWRSGTPTIATSGAAWVRGKKWGRFNGTLAVAALKGSRVVFMKFTKQGKLKWTRSPAALHTHGRLRSITVADNNDLLITTANGSRDVVLRVSPRA